MSEMPGNEQISELNGFYRWKTMSNGLHSRTRCCLMKVRKLRVDCEGLGGENEALCVNGTKTMKQGGG